MSCEKPPRPLRDVHRSANIVIQRYVLQASSSFRSKFKTGLDSAGMTELKVEFQSANSQPVCFEMVRAAHPTKTLVLFVASFENWVWGRAGHL